MNALLEQCEDDVNLAVKKAGHSDHFIVIQEREMFCGIKVLKVTCALV